MATTFHGPARTLAEQATSRCWIWRSPKRASCHARKDFWQIAVQRRSPLAQSGVVLFRVHPASPERLAPLVDAFAAADTTWAGHISIITVDGIQMIAARRR